MGLATPELVDALAREGWDCAAGVPGTIIGPLIRYLGSRADLPYLPLNNEGEALAYAAGAALAGKRPVVALQNSGLGNLVNPLTSLTHLFELPVLLLVSWRGEPGRADAPQHQLMGRATEALLEACEVPYRVARGEPAEVLTALRELGDACRDRPGPVALVLPRGVLASDGEGPGPRAPAPGPPGVLEPPEEGPPVLRRTEALRIMLEVLGEDAAVVASTGKGARELYALRDRPGHFYMVGSMGCVPSLALGVARNAPGDRPVVVLDGDGAALLRLEGWAGVGVHGPARLVHVLLDNGVHDSTGGQATLAGAVDFPALALALGYRGARRVVGRTALREALGAALAGEGPRLVHVPILPGSPPQLPRPSGAPAAWARRSEGFLQGRE